MVLGLVQVLGLVAFAVSLFGFAISPSLPYAVVFLVLVVIPIAWTLSAALRDIMLSRLIASERQ